MRCLYHLDLMGKGGMSIRGTQKVSPPFPLQSKTLFEFLTQGIVILVIHFLGKPLPVIDDQVLSVWTEMDLSFVHTLVVLLLLLFGQVHCLLSLSSSLHETTLNLLHFVVDVLESSFSLCVVFLVVFAMLFRPHAVLGFAMLLQLRFLYAMRQLVEGDLLLIVSVLGQACVSVGRV